MKRVLLIGLGLVTGAASLAAGTAFLVGQPWAGKSTACIAGTTADAKRLEAHVRMLSETLLPRSAADTENLDRVAGYLQGELQKTGAEVELQPYPAKGLEYRNVIARYGPKDPKLPLLVIGAHYDAFEEFPGADDNASGVAGLLELGRLLAANPPSAPVELVAFALEEPPFFRSEDMGSVIHAASLRTRGAKVQGMISLEMLGFFSDAPGSQKFPAKILERFYPNTGNFIAVVGTLGAGGWVRKIKRGMSGATDLPVHSLNGPAALPGVDFSDHQSYGSIGYPSAMVTDTAFYRNPRYHTAEDTADSLDYAKMAKVVQGVDCAIREASRKD